MGALKADFSVRLDRHGLFGRSQAVGLAYLLSLDPDRLLEPCRRALGSPDAGKAEPYGGWESRGIAGHSLGHYLSALAEFAGPAGDPEAAPALAHAVGELKRVRRADGYVAGVPSTPFDAAFSGDFEVEPFSLAGFWVPWYSLHKILAGLVDAASLGSAAALATVAADALEVARGLADWAVAGCARMDDATFSRMLRCEHGGMTAALADLFALTGDPAHLALAERFLDRSVIGPLAAGRDELQGLHANTQIPKLIGAAKLYGLTGNGEYRAAAEFFFDTVTTRRSYAIGGNSIGEHFVRPDREQTARDTCETCNTHNMLRLAEILRSWSGEARYAEYAERALLNHILASQEPETGAKAYFMSTESGHFKVYGSRDDSFWCCTGTGMENPARYGRMAWSLRGDAVSLDVFMASSFVSGGLSLRLETGYPFSDRGTVFVEAVPEESAYLEIRAPEWLAAPLTARFDGREYRCGGGSFLRIPVPLFAGAEVSLSFPMELRSERAKGEGEAYSLRFGPTVLAADLGRENFPPTDTVGDHLSLMAWPGIGAPVLSSGAGTDIPGRITMIDASRLEFRAHPGLFSLGETPAFVPYFALHHRRYALYLSPDAGEDAGADGGRFAGRTVDFVRPGEQQSEVEHGYSGKGSDSWYSARLELRRRFARGEGSFFSYRLAFPASGAAFLALAYDASEGPDGKAPRAFSVFVNGGLAVSMELRGEGVSRLEYAEIPVPREFLDRSREGSAASGDGAPGLGRAEVRIEPRDASCVAGGVYELRSLGPKETDE